MTDTRKKNKNRVERELEGANRVSNGKIDLSEDGIKDASKSEARATLVEMSGAALLEKKKAESIGDDDAATAAQDRNIYSFV